ncbi:MAG: NfeD family protein [Candidatus Gastranaerophilales bacterium]|nr:NfeD family protein [Candidatus Gastranaerophilales bacterium]
MELWMIFAIVAIIATIIEIAAPTLFCLNFAVAGIITALISLYWGSFLQLLTVFLVLSLLSILFLKPFLEKFLKKDSNADFNSQYTGKVVKVIEPVTQSSGAVTIYEERWEARLNAGGEEIPVGCEVKIVKNDSTILYVEKII